MSNQISDKILEAYDQYTEMLACDKKLQKLIYNITEISQKTLKIFKCGGEGSEAQQNDTLNKLDDLYEKAKQEKDSYLKARFDWLYQNYPVIFDLITSEKPPSRDLIKDVLMAYQEVESGKSDKFSVSKRHLDAMRVKQGLPKDFFNWEELRKMSK